MYLDFDPKSLKVAQLRGILNEYDISYPSNAKKTDLIMIFNDEVKPNASKHLQKYEKSIKNLNDVGFINATTGKPVRRSKRSTSADLEDSNATRENKSKATRTSAQASDVSGMESDTEVATKESKKTKRKPKDSKKMKNVSSDESADKTTASADISEIEIETRQELVNVDDGKSDSKGTSKAETKSESSFSNENVFQSPPSSAGTKNIKSPSNYKSPSLSKKRHRENDENQNDTPDKKPRVPSSKSPKSPSVTASKVSSHKKGHLFDDNESSDSDTDIFSKSIINQVKSPKLSKIKKPSSKKSTPIKIDKHTPVKKSTLGDNNITPGDKKSTSGDKKTLHQDTTPSQSSENHQHLSSAKTSSKKTNSVKSSVKKNKSPISDNSFLSLTEEQDDFDKEQSKIKSKGKTSTKRSASGVDVLTSADLASQLGITIQGLPPKDFQLGDNSFAGIKSDTPTKKLSPRSRRNKNQKISQPDFDKLSDDEEEKEEDKGKKFDKIQNGIKEEIEKLNDVLEKENSISIKKPSPISIFSFIGLWLIILSIGLSGYWYREQTYLIGYCGQEINQPTIPQSSDLPGWLIQFGTYLDNNFKPNCVKCPAHARCYPYLEIGCYEDFVEYKPWYFEFLPIINPSLKKCVPDTKKAEKLEIMIDVALDLLRSKNANKNCGKTPVDNFEAGLSVDELHDLLLLMKAPYITKEEFEELWQRSVIELEKEPEIIVRQVIFFRINYFKHGITNI